MLANEIQYFERFLREVVKSRGIDARTSFASSMKVLYEDKERIQIGVELVIDPPRGEPISYRGFEPYDWERY